MINTKKNLKNILNSMNKRKLLDIIINHSYEIAIVFFKIRDEHKQGAWNAFKREYKKLSMQPFMIFLLIDRLLDDKKLFRGIEYILSLYEIIEVDDDK